MADSPEAQLVHLTPSRMRIKVPSRRHDRSFFEAAQQRLSGRAAVEGVEINPTTGSILIRTSDSRALLKELEKDSPLIIVERLPAQEAPSLDQVRQQLIGLNEQLQHWTGIRHDMRVYIFFALVLAAVCQMARGNVFAPAATLLWYASEALRVWGPRDASRADSSL